MAEAVRIALTAAGGKNVEVLPPDIAVYLHRIGADDPTAELDVRYRPATATPTG